MSSALAIHYKGERDTCFHLGLFMDSLLYSYILNYHLNIYFAESVEQDFAKILKWPAEMLKLVNLGCQL